MTTGPTEHQKELQKVPARQGDLPIPNTENQQHTTIISTNRIEIIQTGTTRINRLHLVVSPTAEGLTAMIVPKEIQLAGSLASENHILQENRPIMGKTVPKEAPIATGVARTLLVKESPIHPEKHLLMVMIVPKEALATSLLVKESPIHPEKHLLMVMIVRKEALIAIGVTGNQVVKGSRIRPEKRFLTRMIARKKASIGNPAAKKDPIHHANHHRMVMKGQNAAQIATAVKANQATGNLPDVRRKDLATSHSESHLVKNRTTGLKDKRTPPNG